jgi:hypothetical protein
VTLEATVRWPVMREIEEILLELRAALEPLESGRMQTGKRYSNGPWIDTTQDNIRRLKQASAKYEVAILREEETLQPH